MLKAINIVLLSGLLVLSFWLYQFENRSRMADGEMRRLSGEIAKEKDAIRLLRAEWSYLTRPRRIGGLAQRHLDLEESKPEQIITAAKILERIPERDTIRPPYVEGDMIGELLKELR